LAKSGFLATDRTLQGGISNSGRSRTDLPGRPEARQWVLDKLFEFLDDAHPDYLKWDNNFWINCNRSTHATPRRRQLPAHPLRDVAAAVEDRYPGMDIEDCAGGGHRMS
jgi:hypothetical protein